MKENSEVLARQVESAGVQDNSEPTIKLVTSKSIVDGKPCHPKAPCHPMCIPQRPPCHPFGPGRTE